MTGLPGNDPDHHGVGPDHDGDGWSDEIAIGRDRAPVGRSTRIALGVAALVVLAAIGLVVGLRGSGGGHRARVAQSGVPSWSSDGSLLRFPSTLPSEPVEIVPPTVDACAEVSGGGLSCSVTTQVPAAVVSALRTLLPHAVLDPGARSVVGSGPRLSTRVVSVSVGSHRVVLAVVPEGQVVTVPARARQAESRTDADLDGHHIALFLVGPAGRTGPDYMMTLARIVHDPRLVAVG